MSNLKCFHSLKMKVIILMTGILLGFCVLSTYMWYEDFTQIATETAISSTLSMIDVSSENFGKTLQEINYIAALISSNVNSDMKQIVTNWLVPRSSDNLEILQNSLSLKEYITNMCTFKSYLHGMNVYDFHGHTIGYGASTPAREIQTESWYGEMKEGNVDALFLKPHKFKVSLAETESNMVFSIVRRIKSNDANIGIVQANIKSSLFDDAFGTPHSLGHTM